MLHTGLDVVVKEMELKKKRRMKASARLAMLGMLCVNPNRDMKMSHMQQLTASAHQYSQPYLAFIESLMRPPPVGILLLSSIVVHR